MSQPLIKNPARTPKFARVNARSNLSIETIRLARKRSLLQEKARLQDMLDRLAIARAGTANPGQQRLLDVDIGALGKRMAAVNTSLREIKKRTFYKALEQYERHVSGRNAERDTFVPFTRFPVGGGAPR